MKGASIVARNSDNHTPLYVAKCHGHTGTMKLLEKKASEFPGNIRDVSG